MSDAPLRQYDSCFRWAACTAIVLGLLVTVSNPVDASDSRSVRFQHISRDNGLSQSFIYSIVQDQQGYMWFGTQEGLNRYDGFDFTVFAHDPEDPHSISDDTIRTILEDQSGTLWVGTDAGGLSRYDTARETFTNYLHDPADPFSIGANQVRVIYEDSTGILWIGTDGAGLDRFNPDSETFEHFRHDPSVPGSLSGAHVWSILQHSDGTLWIATNGGLSKFDASNGSFTNFVHDPNEASSISDNRLRTLYEDTENVLWIGTEGGGLNKFSRDTGSFERFVHDPNNASSISANRINTIIQDDAGVLWIGTVKGLNAWRPTTRSFERYFHDPSDRYSLSHDNVLSIFQDRGNVFWVGTYDGLSLWNQATRAMLHYKQDANDSQSLNANTVTSFTENSDGTVWVGTFGGGLNSLDRKTGRFRHIRHQPDDDTSLSSDRVMAVHVDRNGVLWAGTRAAGLNRYNKENNTFTRYRHDSEDPASLSADGVTFILEDSDNGLWIGTFGGGLNYFERETQQFTHYRSDPDDPATLSSDRVLVLFEDSEQKLWIGTYGGGLNRFDPITNTFTRFEGEPGKSDGLSGNVITMIKEDPRGDLWVGTQGGGLNRLRHSDRELGRSKFQRFTEIDGLPSATVYSGIWDQSGHLWLSSTRGISKLNVETLEFRNYDIGHGLQGDEFNLAAGFRASDGQLFFGGLNGFNAFQPNQLGVNQLPPQVAITRFLSLNEPVDLGDARSSRMPVDLSHEQYSIGFEFAALDYAAPENSRYMYKLEGLDKDWVNAGAKRQVTYTNLPAGDYSFRVRAANNNGVWSEQDATLDFRMHAAPWRTWWAYVAYLLILAAVAAFLTHTRRARQAALRKYAKELRSIQVRLTDAQRIASMGNWEWNAATSELWWSDEIYRLLRVEPRSLGATYESFIEHVHPDDRFAVDRAVKRALDDQKRHSTDYRIVQPDGTERVVHGQAEAIVNNDGQLVGMAGTIHDITARKNAEDDIRHRADYQALLARLSTDLIRARPDDIGQQLSDGLKLVGIRYGLDAVSLWWFAEDRESMQSLHRWVRAENKNRQANVARADFPWTAEQLLAGTSIVVDDVDQMSPCAATDQKALKKRRTKSFLIIPLLIDEKLEGAGVFSTFRENLHWSDETVTELKLVTENLAGAVSRSKAVAEIKGLKEQLQEENIYLREEVRLAHGFDEIVGDDPKLKRCLLAVEKVAPTDVAVLILGETGTGKELIARAIHRLSARCDGPMVTVNCPALPAEIIESELFGHEKGAFTGAHSGRRGRFELADTGTIFLDELGELPLELQSKILRVLQTGEFERLGGTETICSDVRIIAATNRELHTSIETGRFRSDLYYRVSSFPIRLPALRERKGDIPLLAEYFVVKHADRLGRKVDAISAKMMKDLVGYAWPGNVRELESIIERALITSTSNSVLDLPDSPPLIARTDQAEFNSSNDHGLDLSAIDRSHIVSILNKTKWKISGTKGAASVLGIPPSTLRSKMKRLGITRQMP